MLRDFNEHPCFDDRARHRFARVHLPVAPECNIACNFCNRKFDCVNESRPGVTSSLLSPGQALAYLRRLHELVAQPISVVGIAGPGDPFANADATLETLRLVRAEYPDLLLCVASNGLCVAPYADQLADLRVSHVTITVNAVDPALGARIYRWVRPTLRQIMRGEEGAAYLLARQREAIQALKRRGIIVKINTIVIPGINDTHIEDVVREMAALGADLQNCIGVYPVEDTPFAEIVPPPAEVINELRTKARAYLPQMAHCARCRADAVGLVGQADSEIVHQAMLEAATGPLNPLEDRPFIAVASREGVLINQHLGQADAFWIFKCDAAGLPELIDRRVAPRPGDGDDRWHALAEQLTDCRVVLVTQAGPKPRSLLAGRGLRVVSTEGTIEDAIEDLHRGREPRQPSRGHGGGCGGSHDEADAAACSCSSCDGPRTGCGPSGCGGSGTGCG